MSKHSNSNNSNYSNFSFSNYLKNPAVIVKNEYENCQNNNLEKLTESFHSSENYQSENIPNFGVAPKFVSAGFGSSPNYENVTKIEFVEDTKSDPKVTSLHDTGLGPNYIKESVDKSVPKFELLHGNEIGPNYITHSIDYTKSLTKATSPHGIGLGPNYVTESVENTKSVLSYNTGLMLNNIKASKAEPLQKLFLVKNLINLLLITSIMDLKNSNNH